MKMVPKRPFMKKSGSASRRHPNPKHAYCHIERTPGRRNRLQGWFTLTLYLDHRQFHHLATKSRILGLKLDECLRRSLGVFISRRLTERVQRQYPEILFRSGALGNIIPCISRPSLKIATVAAARTREALNPSQLAERFSISEDAADQAIRYWRMSSDRWKRRKRNLASSTPRRV